jgi:hypothetical protein
MTTPCESKYDIEKLNKAVYGNDKLGLITEVEVIKLEVREIKESISSMATSLASLAKSQIEFDVTEKLKVKMQEKKYQMIKVISIIFGITIPLTALIFNLKL